MITSKQYFDLVKDEWCRSEEQYKLLLNDFIAFAKIYNKEHQEALLREIMQSDEEDGLYQGGAVKSLKDMKEATVIDYCNEVKELFELPSHSNNAWKKAILENAIVKMQEVLENF